MKSILSIIVIALTFLAVPSQAQVATPVQLIPSNVNEDQDFGYSVDLDGDVAVVGAFRDEDSFPLESGAAYVFRFDGSNWTEEARLRATTPESLNWLGWDVAISGTAILVSERRGDEFAMNAGNVIVYRYTGGGWTEEDIILPPDSAASDFGYAVDIDGDVVAVGAPFTAGSVANEGAVYVYRKNGSQWDLEDTLFGSDLSLQSLFGSAISIDGDRMLISAFNADDSTSNQAGKLYVFDYDGSQWNESAVLQSNRSNNIANLGISAALDGDWAVGGAPLDNEAGGGAGAALIYRYDGANWNFHSKLFASDGRGFFLFGSSVALSGNHLLVTAEGWFPPNGNSTGKAYLFEYDSTMDTWIKVEDLVPAGLPQAANFGHAAAMQDEVILIGAPEYDGSLDASGAAFIFGAPLVGTSVEDELPVHAFSVSKSFPNPFVHSTSVLVTPSTSDPVRAALYDILGREVKTLFEGRLPANIPSSIEVAAEDLPNGLYWIRIHNTNDVISRSVMLVR